MTAQVISERNSNTTTSFLLPHTTAVSGLRSERCVASLQHNSTTLNNIEEGSIIQPKQLQRDLPTLPLSIH